MRWILPLLVALAVWMGSHAPARATIQEESCLAPDIEYPVPCDDDDD